MRSASSSLAEGTINTILKNKILITGACGWLGINLIKTYLDGIDIYDETKNLSSKYDVKVFILPHEYIKLFSIFGDRIEYFFGDITNKIDCLNFISGSADATLIHLVGLIHPKKITELYDINYQGVKNITEASIKEKLKRIIALSSNSPFGINKSIANPFNETTKYNPYLNYGNSKKKMEEYLVGIKQEEKIEVIIIRAMWFYGPYQPDRQNLFFKMIVNGKVPLVGNGSNLRSMSNTENLSYGITLASEMNYDKKNFIFWVADENPYSQLEIILTIRDILESDFNIKSKQGFLKLPNVASSVAYYVDNLMQKFNLYNSKIHVLSELNKNIFCEINYSKKYLNYNPKIDLKIGLRRNFMWMKENKNLIF